MAAKKIKTAKRVKRDKPNVGRPDAWIVVYVDFYVVAHGDLAIDKAKAMHWAFELECDSDNRDVGIFFIPGKKGGK